jgi:hypothetical protein
LAVGYWGPTQNLLNVETLSAFELLVVLLASTGAFWAVELEKAARRRGQGRSSSTSSVCEAL